MLNFENKNNKNIQKTLIALSMFACVNTASAAVIELTNQGFETGDLTGWSTIGDVVAAGETSVETDNGTTYTLSPNETTMAYLNGSGASVSEIESFFGIASGTLYNAQSTGYSVNQNNGFELEGGEDFPSVAFEGGDFEGGDFQGSENGNYQLSNGSAISQSFTANAGDTIDMSWNYVARDYISYTDPSFAVLVAPDGSVIVDVLASTTGPGLVTGSDGISGVFSFAELLDQTGEYTLGFAVTNSADEILSPALFLDDAAGDCNPSCNEVGSPENPILPNDPEEGEELTESEDDFEFTFTVEEPDEAIFIDPIVAVGYDYVVSSGPNVASVILPSLEFGDDHFEIWGWGGYDFTDFLGDAYANVEFDFGPDGVDRFRVLGIEAEELLDPEDDNAFVTGLKFVDTGPIEMTQTPIEFDYNPDAVDVPVPGTLPLYALGLFSCYFLRRRV